MGRVGRGCQKARRYPIAGEVEKIQAKTWWRRTGRSQRAETPGKANGRGRVLSET